MPGKISSNLKKYGPALALTFAAAVWGWNHYRNKGEEPKPLPYADLLARIDSAKVDSLKITADGQTITGFLPDKNEKFTTQVPRPDNATDRLVRAHAHFDVKDSDNLVSTVTILTNLCLLGFLVYTARSVMKKMPGVQKSTAKILNKEDVKVKFKDVEGIDEAKAELQEIVDFLKDPKKFTDVGAKISDGILLVGPPGTGKTLLAKAVAGEANVPFYSVSGSDFDEFFMGSGLARVKSLFQEARKNAPCIIFIDEIDALGKDRDIESSVSNDEREKTLNQFLVEMDGIGNDNEGIILIAATNRPDVLDKALMRPGRFNRRVTVPLPDAAGRGKIMDIYLNPLREKGKVDPNVNTHAIVKKVPGFSGADIANLVNEAALFARRNGHTKITMADFDQARDRILLGAERRSMVLSEEERRLTAYHEAGHAIVQFFTRGSDPLEKLTIVPRGDSLGLAVSEAEDRHFMTSKGMHNRLAQIYGGRAAEELIFGADEVTTGAAGDIEQVTQITLAMIETYGMSTAYGLIKLDDISAETADIRDQEIRRITTDAEKKAKQTLSEHIDHLHLLAEALLEHETLSGGQIREILERPAERTGKPSASARVADVPAPDVV